MQPVCTPLESVQAASVVSLPQPWPGRATTIASAALAALGL